MTDRDRSPLVVDIGPLREDFYTGIPNVVAEVCSRLLEEDWLDVHFDLDGRWVDHDSLRQCLAERSGRSLGPKLGSFRPAVEIADELRRTGRFERSVALYCDHRPPVKRFPKEGKIVYDLSMVLAPECHPAGSVQMYTHNLGEQIAASDVLFCISRSTARDVAWVFGVEPERIKVALLGNDTDLEASQRVRDRIGKRPVEPFLLMLGSIEPRKNVAMVLDWLSRYPDVLEGTRIVFAGRQAWGDSFETLVRNASLESALAAGRIVFPGYVDSRLKAALLTGASALLYPSLFEGFGLPLLEAMTVGTPVLSSVSTSMPEVVGDCGYYFDPCDVASLDAAYRTFLTDRASGRIAETIRRASARAATFSYQQTYDIILDGLFPGGSQQV